MGIRAICFLAMFSCGLVSNALGCTVCDMSSSEKLRWCSDELSGTYFSSSSSKNALKKLCENDYHSYSDGLVIRSFCSDSSSWCSSVDNWVASCAKQGSYSSFPKCVTDRTSAQTRDFAVLFQSTSATNQNWYYNGDGGLKYHRSLVSIDSVLYTAIVIED